MGGGGGGGGGGGLSGGVLWNSQPTLLGEGWEELMNYTMCFQGLLSRLASRPAPTREEITRNNKPQQLQSNCLMFKYNFLHTQPSV